MATSDGIELQQQEHSCDLEVQGYDNYADYFYWRYPKTLETRGLFGRRYAIIVVIDVLADGTVQVPARYEDFWFRFPLKSSRTHGFDVRTRIVVANDLRSLCVVGLEYNIDPGMVWNLAISDLSTPNTCGRDFPVMLDLGSNNYAILRRTMCGTEDAKHELNVGEFLE